LSARRDDRDVTDRSANGSYREDDLLACVQRALEITDADPDNPTHEDLAALDEFHLGGRAATRDLADLVELEPDDRVLDAGCGIGGPARTLAAEYGCAVVGLDRLATYPRVARWLSARVGLADRVAFLQGDATALPVADATFDAVWLQHAGMNVAAKTRLFDELYRAVRPGGILALHEVCAGPTGSPRFPVPWASDPTGSHLLGPDQLAGVVADAGFEPVAWTDTTDGSLAGVRAAVAARDRGETRTSVLDLLVDAAEDAVFETLVANLESGRVSVVMGAFRRPGSHAD
jgi:SAM-dependent methyltransferase